MPREGCGGLPKGGLVGNTIRKVIIFATLYPISDRDYSTYLSPASQLFYLRYWLFQCPRARERARVCVYVRARMCLCVYTRASACVYVCERARVRTLHA